ncbi:MAG: L-threonylcarbamoyladenylate synthase [Deltaproteobacteria bacterium]|jgi:tRNA threonylcarbamoyl adenosine modification protein (Sua5/YciO/YrdC/YwlC family)|nr:L-threonylcarbamoyladenylate synthase [Deltaproteobacteria bacterium]MCW8893177.1 L-threonylcarbamoyladenylate synthase [Deltaproteobacteria bacterium]
MFISINPVNPQPRLISQIVKCLQQGGVIVYPTDTTYGIGCDIFNRKGVKKIFQIKQRESKKPFSFICTDLAEISNYAQVSNFAFKIMKRHLPGPFTFVLEATKIVPDSLSTKQKTVGLRIPDNAICHAIVKELGHPLVTTSANVSGEVTPQDPRDIDERLGRLVDFVIDGGISMDEASTVISLLDDNIEVIRQGSGDTSWIE